MPHRSSRKIKEVEQQYNTIADQFAQTRNKPIHQEIVQLLPQLTNSDTVLDVGCANGRLISALKLSPEQYTGMDISKELLLYARSAFPSHTFLHKDATAKSSWKALKEYDVITCLAVLHHIPDRSLQHELLQNMYQHTKPGGWVLITVWNLLQFRFWKLHLSQLHKKITSGDIHHIWVPYSGSDGKTKTYTIDRFCTAYLPGELLSLVRQVGFTPKTYYYASNGKTHQSILIGNNFCILAKKPQSEQR